MTITTCGVLELCSGLEPSKATHLTHGISARDGKHLGMVP
jgi:hypothetical protein